MRLSNTTSACMTRQDGSRIPINEGIELLYAAGFRGVDIHLADSIYRQTELTRDDWKDWAHKTKEQMDSLGMVAGQSHAPFYNVLSPDIDDRDYKEEMVRRAIIASAVMGVKWVTLHPGTNFADGRLSRGLDGNIAYFSRHLELAEQVGVGIAIENLPDLRQTATDPTGKVERVQRRFGAALEELTGLVDHLSERFGNVGICWDMGHAHISGHDQSWCLRQIGGRLKSIHVHDNKGDRDVHMPPYSGSVDWQPIISTLRDIGYTGDFALECFRFTNQLPQPLMAEALRYSYCVGEQLLSLA